MVNYTTPGYLAATHSLAKKEFEIANIYLADTYKYVPTDLHHYIRNAQEIINRLAEAMQDFINIENSGQPEKK